jgi:hypothetical protein
VAILRELGSGDLAQAEQILAAMEPGQPGGIAGPTGISALLEVLIPQVRVEHVPGRLGCARQALEQALARQ